MSCLISGIEGRGTFPRHPSLGTPLPAGLLVLFCLEFVGDLPDRTYLGQPRPPLDPLVQVTNGEAVRVEKKDEEQEEESGGRGRSPAKEVRGRSPQKEIISLSPSKSESSIVSPFFKKSEY